MKITVLILFIFCGSFNAMAQDTIEPTKTFDTTHSPKKATILSAVLPGAGQVYNKKWWKTPIIYAAFGTCLYIAIDNNSNYVTYFAELSYRKKNNGQTLNPDFELFSDAVIIEQMNYHQKWRDNFFIFTGVAYILNIIDANVDAHFFNFDVSPDLSLNIKPFSNYTQINNKSTPVNGLTFTLKLK